MRWRDLKMSGIAREMEEREAMERTEKGEVK
jgi:hypothetical protein